MIDHDAQLDAELANAPRGLSNHLFHYTTAEAAIFGILRSGTLRLSPFESTNDLWESRPLYPSLTVHAADRPFDGAMDLWNDVDRVVRLHAKLACLTQDWQVPSAVFEADALRGWNHLSLWAHYGSRHAGVCLQFARDKLIDAFSNAKVPGALLRFHGPVVYRRASVGAGPYGLDLGQIREFGLDAVAIAHAETHQDQLFFRKHADWSNENEYRLVLLDQSVLPVEFDIREALTGIFLGDSFPSGRVPSLLAALGAYPNVNVFQLRYHNRRLICSQCAEWMKRDAPNAAHQVGFSHQSGSLQERLASLRASILSARQQREKAASVCAEHIHALADLIEGIAMEAQAWSKTDVAVHPSITAVPEAQRSRAPGVPGESVQYERGYMCVVENLPKCTHTLVAGLAFQCLGEDRFRIHGVIKTEHWRANGNERVELWRDVCEVPLFEAAAAIRSIFGKLHDALQTARSVFDADRDR